MSSDFVVKGSEHEIKLDHLVGHGAVLSVTGFGAGFAGKAASIFCQNKSLPQKILKTTSSFGIFAGVLGLAALGSAYFLWNSVTDTDIAKQQAMAEENENNTETPLLNFVQESKLSWLKTKKDIQQAIYSILGWRE